LILAEASNRDRIGTRSQTQAQKEQSMPEANSIQFNRDNRYPSRGRDVEIEIEIDRIPKIEK
jgi:hypothetical protein